METRKNFYLIGTTVEDIKGCKLPSYRQAFGHFLHLHIEKKMTTRDASTNSVRKVISFWEKAQITTRLEKHCISKLEKVFEDWKVLKKYASRESESHTNKERDFIEHLDYLFDISYADCEKLVKYQEDWNFLQQQR